MRRVHRTPLVPAGSSGDLFGSKSARPMSISSSAHAFPSIGLEREELLPVPVHGHAVVEQRHEVHARRRDRRPAPTRRWLRPAAARSSGRAPRGCAPRSRLAYASPILPRVSARIAARSACAMRASPPLPRACELPGAREHGERGAEHEAAHPVRAATRFPAARTPRRPAGPARSRAARAAATPRRRAPPRGRRGSSAGRSRRVRRARHASGGVSGKRGSIARSITSSASRSSSALSFATIVARMARMRSVSSAMRAISTCARSTSACRPSPTRYIDCAVRSMSCSSRSVSRATSS